MSLDMDRAALVHKYGTFLDSKEEIVKLYLLFTLCGIVAAAEGADESIGNRRGQQCHRDGQQG